MKISELKEFPQLLITDVSPEFKPVCLHESLTQSHQILAKVIELLHLGTPQSVILEIIDEIRSGEQWRTIYDADGSSLTTTKKIRSFKEDRWQGEACRPE